VGLVAAIAYQLDRHWGFLTRVRVARLVGDAADSPVVAEKIQPLVGTFLAYRF
jgi:outer membrane scaffolding protein for murein synthesis (MipA/OmpV family)